MHFENELDPGAEKEPEKYPGRPTVHEPLPRIASPRQSDQQRSQCNGRKPTNIEFGKYQKQQYCRKQAEETVKEYAAIVRMQ